MKIIQNYLDQEYFKFLQKEILTENYYPFYFNKTTDEDNHIYFTHILYLDGKAQSSKFDTFEPFLKKLNVQKLIRIKINLYPRNNIIVKHKPHIDLKESHKGLIFSLNTCDGGTYVGGQFVQSIENQALFFDPSKPHNSTNCTDHWARFNINFNYF